MKKFLTLAILSISSLAFVPSIEAKSTNSESTTVATTANTLAPQYQRRYNQRRVRVVTQTRNVRRGRFLYRETYRTRYQPNGRVVTRLISRVRIGRY